MFINGKEAWRIHPSPQTSGENVKVQYSKKKVWKKWLCPI